MCFPNTYLLCMLLHVHFVNPLYLQTCLYNAFILSIRLIFLYNLSSFVMKLSKSRRVNVWCFTNNCLWLCNRVTDNAKILSTHLTLHDYFPFKILCFIPGPFGLWKKVGLLSLYTVSFNVPLLEQIHSYLKLANI